MTFILGSGSPRRKELLAAEKKRLQVRVTAAKGETQPQADQHQHHRERQGNLVQKMPRRRANNQRENQEKQSVQVAVISARRQNGGD